MAHQGQTRVGIQLLYPDLEKEGILSIVDNDCEEYNIPRQDFIDEKVSVIATTDGSEWISKTDGLTILELQDHMVSSILRWAYVNIRFTYDTIIVENDRFVVTFPAETDGYHPWFGFSLDQIGNNVKLTFGDRKRVWYDSHGIIHISGPTSLITDVSSGSLLYRKKS